MQTTKKFNKTVKKIAGQAGHDHPAVRIESEILSDGSTVFNLMIQDATIYCRNEAEAIKYGASINAAITNAILGLPI